MSLVLITAPSADPVSLAEFKRHVRVSHDDEDSTFQIYLTAAIQHLDGPNGILGRCLIEQEWAAYFDCFPARSIRIPLGQLRSVTSIEYADPATGNMVTMSASGYLADTHSFPGRIIPVESWPVTKSTINAVKVTFKAGFGATPDSIPGPLKSAIMLHAAHFDLNRQSVTESTGTMVETPQGYEDLIMDYRAYGFGEA